MWGISLEVKDTFYIFIRLFCKLFFAHVVGFCQGFKYFYHEGALIALSAIWNGSHVWRVGFQNNAVHRNHGREAFKSSHLREDLPAVVPLDRIVLETDSPYMAPVPYRGKRNESAFVVEVMKTLAKAYGISEEEFARQTNLNAERVFPLSVSQV